MPRFSHIESQRVIWLLVMGYFTAHALLLFTYKYLDDLANARRGTFWLRLIEETTGAYTTAILLPFIIIFARKFRVERHNLLRRLPLHLLAIILFSATHTTINLLSRQVLYSLASLGEYKYGNLPIRYAMEFANDAILYCLLLTFLYLFDHYRESKNRELKTSKLEARLTQAQLQALRLQLQPHFLFNTLNTISSVIYEDVQRADRMIAQLSDLLRMTLRNSQSQEVTLKEEIQFLNLYLEIMRARFEERLMVNFDIEKETKRALVPQLLLQPLVENSIRHASTWHSRAIEIGIRARRENGALVLDVTDNGPGFTKDPTSELSDGIGLSNTSERLNYLYGSRHHLTFENINGGGLAIRIQIPFRISGEVREPSDNR